MSKRINLNLNNNKPFNISYKKICSLIHFVFFLLSLLLLIKFCSKYFVCDAVVDAVIGNCLVSWFFLFQSSTFFECCSIHSKSIKFIWECRKFHLSIKKHWHFTKWETVFGFGFCSLAQAKCIRSRILTNKNDNEKCQRSLQQKKLLKPVQTRHGRKRENQW